MIRDRLKQMITASALGERVYAAAQETWFDSSYRKRRERYQDRVRGDASAHHQLAHLARAREKIAARGHRIVVRQPTDVHCFAYVPSDWWHQNQIVDGLRKIGPVTRFDYIAAGWSLKQLKSRAPGHAAARLALFERLLAEVRTAHRERPLDLFFSYGLGWDLSADVVRQIQDELGIPCVNVSLDDKNWWDEIERGDAASGLKNLAPAFDLSWTAASAVLSWYWAEGGQAVFIPEGVNVDWFAPQPEVPQDIEVGFVGSRFGHRPQILRELKKAGINAAVRGLGWPGGAINDEEMLRFFNRCQLNLGLGDMHFSRWLTNLKGRDFEIPAVGRGVYLTTYNADLAASFHVGREIHCYRGVDELIELARHSLRNREESAAMAARARARCVAEHQWQHRYLTLLRHLGIIASG